MKVDLAVLCDYAIVDRLGKLSVMGIFEHLWIQQFPAVHPRVHLVLRLKGRRTEIGDHAVRIRLLDEEDNEILGGNGVVTLSEPPAGVVDWLDAGTVLVFDVPLTKPGPYRFDIYVDDAVLASVPMTVALASKPPR